MAIMVATDLIAHCQIIPFNDEIGDNIYPAMQRAINDGKETTTDYLSMCTDPFNTADTVKTDKRDLPKNKEGWRKKIE